MVRNGLRTLVGILAVAAALNLAPARADVPPPALDKVIAAVLPTVVEIRTVANTPQGRMYFDGSGFIIEKSGIIVTNRHVIAGAYEITVSAPGLPQIKATPLFISEGIDLALLKVNAGHLLPTVTLGDSDTVRIGDRVMLIGNPLGVGESVSFGIVSALNRDIGETLYDHFIQTDAALNHGNSGGAMFNMAGEVIGINTGLTSSPGNTGSIGIGYAMPINDAKFVISQYLRDGRVVAGTVGVHAQRMTEDLAAAFGLPRAQGAIVTGIDPGSPAAGKIREGDIILSVNDHDATDTRAVARMIATTPPGQPLALTLLRGGEQKRVTIDVAAMEHSPKKAMAFLGHPPAHAMMSATPSDPGMGLAAIDPKMRHEYELDDDEKGVVVTSVSPKSVAAQRRIAPGDVILSVDGHHVSTPAEVQQHLRAVSARGVRFAALLIASSGHTHWVALPLEADRP